MIEVSAVSKTYESPAGPVAVLRELDLRVAASESIAIVGPSGSGKTTLLNLLGALDQPSAGSISIDDTAISGLTPEAAARFRNRSIGFIFQLHYLLPQCTVLENVLVPTLASSRRREEAGSKNVRLLTSAATGESTSERAHRLLKRVGLSPRLDHFPRQLSGGESQRVAVVRALINSPRLLLADEPTGSLDHAAALSLSQLLVEINKEEGVTLIIVTHSRELAKQMGRVLELEDGKWKVQ